MASTIILSDNGASSGSAGLKQTAGNDGVLILQTTTSGGTATNALYVDTSQNVGIGITPSAWGSTYKALDILYGGIAATTAGSANTEMTHNAYYNGTNWIAKYTGGYGTRYAAGDGGHAWHTSSTTTTGGSAITFTQAMTLDASGNLLVGGTSVTNPAGWSKGIQVYNASYPYLSIKNSTKQYDWAGYGGDLWLYDATAGATRLVVDSSGRLLVGATSTLSTEKLSVQTSVGTGYSNLYLYSSNASYGGSFANFTINSATSGAYEFLRMFTSTQEVLRISGNGNIANLNNSYTAISDIKLKENIVDATPKLAELMQVRIVNYNLKENPELKQIGVVAQELEQIFPALIDELRDTDAEGNDLGTTTKSVKYSVFVPMLIKAIQEQQAIIEQLKARLDAANL